MEYRGYTAVVRFDDCNDKFTGSVIGTCDTIYFEGTSVAELRQAFQEAVDGYLALCEKLERRPSRCYSGRLTLHLEPELHKRVAARAEKDGCSVNRWIAERLGDAVTE